MASAKNQIEKITPKITTFIHLMREEKILFTKVYLYGSYAKGKAHKWSDIDVCVISPKFKDLSRATIRLAKLSWKVSSDIEPVAFSPKDFVDENPLVWEIKQHGIEIQLNGTAGKRVPKKREKIRRNN